MCRWCQIKEKLTKPLSNGTFDILVTAGINTSLHRELPFSAAFMVERELSRTESSRPRAPQELQAWKSPLYRGSTISPTVSPALTAVCSDWRDRGLAIGQLRRHHPPSYVSNTSVTLQTLWSGTASVITTEVLYRWLKVIIHSSSSPTENNELVPVLSVRLFSPFCCGGVVPDRRGAQTALLPSSELSPVRPGCRARVSSWSQIDFGVTSELALR